ncbi:MAG TPA: ATP-binding protein [Woeseiaceae bacterium]|nr:ATP-binding protein [Woeseiaceae bacterium]
MSEHPDDIDDAGRAQVRLGALLRDRREEIVRLWKERAREISPARELSSRALVDHLPKIIRRIADALDSGQRGATTERADDTAEQHALDRLGRGFELEQVIQEYQILRRCILELWGREAGPFDPAELNALWDVIEQLIATSAARYSRASERMLRAVDRVSAAALEAGDLNVFFDQLLEVTLESLEVADTLVILLRDGDRLRVSAAAGEAEALGQGLSTPLGEGFAGTIAAGLRPLIVSESSAEEFADSRLLREQGMRALFGLPLVDAEQSIGVAYVGSRTAAEFSEHDKLLFRTVVSRAALAVKNARLRARNAAILDAALDCVVSIDSGGDIVGWNRAAEQTFGWSRAEVLGAAMVDLIVPPSLRSAHCAGFDHYLATGHGRYMDRRVETSAIRRDGTEFPIELTITRVPGEQPLLFTGFVRDLSSYNAAEQERTRLLEELKRAETVQRFLSEAGKELAQSLDSKTTLAAISRLAVPAIADWCVVDIVEQGKLHRVSVAHAEPSKEALAVDIARRYPPDPNAQRGAVHVVRTGRTEFVPHIPDALLGEVARDAQHLEMLRALGLKSYISAPIKTHEGQVLGAISLVRAESERRYTEADVLVAEELALRAAAAIENARLYTEARAAIRSREDVLAIVSHDLRNPLESISLSAHLVATHLHRMGATDMDRKQVEVIQRAAGRMAHLIGDLLDMASIQAGRLAVEARPTELVPLLNEAYAAHEPLAVEANIALCRDLPVEGGRVLCDPRRIQQALSNLLGNAIKFCRSGDAVTLRACRQDNEFVVSVADTGPGMTREDLDAVFQQYWSARQDGKKGTGLGLFVAKGIIEAHGGRIRAESRPGEGATFFFTLPAV